jgi:hypothetical protein
MPEPTSEKHYESKFEFPLWKLIKNRAEEKDISYSKATSEILPEYVKTIRYGDKAFEDPLIARRHKEMREMLDREQKEAKRS